MVIENKIKIFSTFLIIYYCFTKNQLLCILKCKCIGMESNII